MLSVLTYNIHKGFRPGNRTLVTEAMRAALFEADPDVVFLQEIVGQHTRHFARFPDWPSSQPDFFRGDDRSHVAYGKNMIYPAGHHGNALLSRYPFEYETNLDLTVFEFAKRGALYALIRIPGQRRPLHLFSAHLGLIEYERRVQLNRICDYVLERIPAEDPLIIAGDFNDWWQNVSVTVRERLDAREVFEESQGQAMKTFPSWMPTWRLDRIYVRGLELVSCARPTGAPWNRLSDHLPLMATLAFKA